MLTSQIGLVERSKYNQGLVNVDKNIKRNTFVVGRMI